MQSLLSLLLLFVIVLCSSINGSPTNRVSPHIIRKRSGIYYGQPGLVHRIKRTLPNIEAHAEAINSYLRRLKRGDEYSEDGYNTHPTYQEPPYVPFYPYKNVGSFYVAEDDAKITKSIHNFGIDGYPKSNYGPIYR